MNRVNLLIICLAMILFGCTTTNEFAVRETFSFNTNWAFYRGDILDGQKKSLDDTQWMPVTIPHCMRLEKKHCGGNRIYKGIGWYRRYFVLKKEDQGKKIFFDFEGVMRNCRVFVNGKAVDLYQRKPAMRESLSNAHYGGYLGFRVDATDLVKFGENNVIALRVDASDDPLTPPGKAQGKMDFYYYSGIYRDVQLIKSNRLRISNPLEVDRVAGGGVYFRYFQKENNVTELLINTTLINDFNKKKEAHLVTTLYTDKKEVVATSSSSFVIGKGKEQLVAQKIMIKNAHLWNINDPYRYLVKTEVKVAGKTVDQEWNHLGIRFFKLTNKGVYINEGIKTGKKTYLRGANRHQAYPNVGDAASNSMQEREVIQLKQGGYNAVRAAHYPQDPAFLDACDKYGLLVLECIPGWQFYNHDSIFNKRLYTINKEMIRRDRNHASIFLWEIALNESRYPKRVAKKLYEIAHAENPTEQMYTSGDYYGHEDMVDCFDAFYKQVSRFPKDGNVNSNYVEDQVSVAPLFTREWGDGVGEKPRVSLTENEEEQMKQCRGRFEQLNGNGYFDWSMLDANPNMGGHFVWSYNDYARGCCEETLYCGVVDINRWPKFSYYMLQSMRDKNDNQKGLYKGPMVYIASYNDKAAFSSSSTDIMVFSNCDAVKLYRNQKLIGVQTREQRAPFYQNIVDKGGSPAFVFDAKKYEPGELKVEGLIDNKVVATHAVLTPLAPHHLELEFATKGIAPSADGSDMIPVYVKVCDKNGTVIPTASTTVNLVVTGEGYLIGEKNRRVAIEQQQVEGGIGFAFVRCSDKEGSISVTASAKGLISANQEIVTNQAIEQSYLDGEHGQFKGKEEDHVVKEEKESLATIVKYKKRIPFKSVEVVTGNKKEKIAKTYDGNVHTWWIAEDNSLPQTVLITLAKPIFVFASQIMFQKDSSTYTHFVEISEDGKTWTELYRKACTGWDFQPVLVNKKFQFMRLTITNVSEGNAGISELVLFEK